MDPVTTAIVAAVSAGLDTAGKEAVKDAYQGLKQVIKKRLGITGAINDLEIAPDAKRQQQRLTREMAARQAHKDAQVAALAGRDGSEDEELRLRFSKRPSGRMNHLPHAAECCALRYFLEGKKAYGLKAKELLPGGLVKRGEWYTIDNFIWSINCWSAWPPSTYALISDLYTPEEKKAIERLFLYRARVFVSRFNYNFNMTWFRQAGAGCAVVGSSTRAGGARC